MSSLEWNERDDHAVKITRALAADAVQKAGNGHPGTAISLAPVAYMLFHKVMNCDPHDPEWIGRDRFVLSAGHASLMLYTQLFLGGFGLELDDLKSLRSWGSKTPGHPEYHHTAGVEMTTGPLGQGFASAVGMAMAARKEHGLLDSTTPLGESVFDHFVYVIAGEGCLEEGITSEASSLAGTQKLGNLIVIFDENRITIEDRTSIAFTEDVLARYDAYGWHTQEVSWRNDEQGTYEENLEALYEAIIEAQSVNDKPSIIKLNTVIAWPTPKLQDTASAHGNALGDEAIKALKEELGLNPNTTFDVPGDLLAYTRDGLAQRAALIRRDWDARFRQWQNAHPANADLLRRLLNRSLPEHWDDALPKFSSDQSVSTRAASGKVLTALKDVLPELWGGSADLAGSNNTTMDGELSFIPEDRSSHKFVGNPFGRTLHFGIREHAMGAIVNGIALSGLTRPYGGTFFVFADYMRPAVRLASIMRIPTVFVWTHDSIGVGEDGPTHQPIEHLWAYRAIPGLNIVRPADANETVYAWRGALEHVDSPTGLVLSRQNLPVIDRDLGDGVQGYSGAEGTLQGAYVLADGNDVIIIATGSEVSIALEARRILGASGVSARVVSAPCLEWFDEQSEEYRESVLPHSIRARVSVEAGSTFGWARYIGDAGCTVGIDHFGASAPGNELFQRFGITPEAVAEAAHAALSSTAK